MLEAVKKMVQKHKKGERKRKPILAKTGQNVHDEAILEGAQVKVGTNNNNNNNKSQYVEHSTFHTQIVVTIRFSSAPFAFDYSLFQYGHDHY